MSNIEVVAHTPGPWFAFLGDNGSFDIGDQVNLAPASILCSRYDWIEQKEVMHANARLIAAAPDLLAALIAFDEIGNTMGVRKQIYAAIALATGSQS